jgi:Icc-related predicted phosphoesterase
MHIDIISDIHLDFYARFNQVKTDALIKRLLNSKTDNIFDVLIIAGDIGHYNEDNFYFLKQISRYYKKVFITWGNHDLYLLPSHKEKYQHSFNRLNELKEMVKEIENLTFLDGKKVEYEGISIWGSGLWYEVSSLSHWVNYMNDAKYIYDKKGEYKIVMPYDIYPVKFNFNPAKLYEDEYEKIEKLDNADIIISHIPPINVAMVDTIGDNYYFVPYGEMIIEKVKPKYWIFGHTHKNVFKKFGDTQLICNPLGYPEENDNFKLISIEV